MEKFLELFLLIQKASDELGVKSYLVGGFVRDFLLGRESSDIDILVDGTGTKLERCGIALCELLADKHTGGVYAEYKNFGTAKITLLGEEVEFVGARKEFYMRESRKPIVEIGTVIDDLTRRDFTINALAYPLSKDKFLSLYDIVGGAKDLQNGVIRTVNEPNVTFSDDPLRMMRAIRFATQLGFEIESSTWEGIKANAERIKIISGERIYIELEKMLKTKNSHKGIKMLYECGLLQIIMKELFDLDSVENYAGSKHKNNFWHTVDVLKKLDECNAPLILKWVGVFHDWGKFTTRHFDKVRGWTFDGHHIQSVKMLEKYIRRVKFQMDPQVLKRIKILVEYHEKIKPQVTQSIILKAIETLTSENTDLLKYDKVKGWRYNGFEYHDFKTLKTIVNSSKQRRSDKFINLCVTVKYKFKSVQDGETTDSSLRRIITETDVDGEMLYPSLLMFGKCDTSSGDIYYHPLISVIYSLIEVRCEELIAADNLRNFKIPTDGTVIMETFGLPEGSFVGKIKDEVKRAILNGTVKNEYADAFAFMLAIAKEKFNLDPV